MNLKLFKDIYFEYNVKPLFERILREVENNEQVNTSKQTWSSMERWKKIQQEDDQTLEYFILIFYIIYKEF
jgi:hypothetical protein